MADNGQNGMQLRKAEKDKKTKNAVYAQRYRDKIRADPELHRLQKLKDQARNQRRKPNLTEEQAARQREQARERTRLYRARKKEKASSSTHPTPVASNTRCQTRRNVHEQKIQRQKWREEKVKQRKNWSGQKRRRHREVALAYYYTHKRKQTSCESQAADATEKAEADAGQHTTGDEGGVAPSLCQQQQSTQGAEAQVVQFLDPETSKTTYVPVDLPDLAPKPSSGQDCRQPVLPSPGPASRERLGPQPHLPACAPFPVLLIGPREKTLLSQLCPLKAESIKEEVHWSSLQQNLSVDYKELTVPPVGVKKEPMEEYGFQSYDEREVAWPPQENAAPPVIKTEPVDEDGDAQCYDERGVDWPTQENAAPPVIKTEPVDEDGDAQCYDERGVAWPTQENAAPPVVVKTEPVDEDGDDCSTSDSR